MKQICDLANCSEKVLGIILPSARQQLIDVDFGVFAIPFASDILNGFGVTGKRFDVGKMRSHLLWKKNNLHDFREAKNTPSYQKGILFM